MCAPAYLVKQFRIKLEIKQVRVRDPSRIKPSFDIFSAASDEHGKVDERWLGATVSPVHPGWLMLNDHPSYGKTFAEWFPLWDDGLITIEVYAPGGWREIDEWDELSS